MTKTQHKNKIIALFINKIENYSDYPLNIQQTTNNLKNLLHELNNNNNFIIINSYISCEIYENIKLLNKNLTPRSTSIKLARHMNAEYILYSTAYNDTKNINIKLELISAKNGEIMWSKITNT
ncbi:hypothetical protein [Blochmannia endosymbiont of Polyrhachis (Hedomyrma) turneri]|uniref:hypothetical protein n=1 Tax=Blochmannia endosymbiont of Polyrhachis (Hedomyrma) turneri TaxID=1505596 RepID=UPI003B21258E